MKKFQYFLLLMLFALPIKSSAQYFVEFTAQSSTVDCETNSLSIDIDVLDFIQMDSFDYSFHWDPTVLTLTSIDNPMVVPNIIIDQNGANAGTLTFSWVSAILTGTTIPAETLVTLNFDLIGNTVQTSDLTFDNTPTSINITQYGMVLNSSQYTLVDGLLTITDTTPPTITCPTDITVNSNGAISTIVNNIELTATDNCSTPTISYMTLGSTSITGNGDASGNTFFVGTTMITYTAIDEGGNNVDCIFNVTVIQDPLIIECPMNVNQGTDSNVCSATLDLPVTILSDPNNVNTISWDITGTSGPASGNGNISNFTFNLGTSNVLYTVTDISGNTETCSFNVTINDLEGPVISGIPADITVECDNIPTTANLTANDQCDGITIVNLISESTAAGPIPGSTITTRTWSTVDVAGNISIANQSITGIDTTPPSLMCPPDIFTTSSVPLGCGANVTWTEPTASDNCDNDIQIASSSPFSSGDLFPLGTTVITYFAIDDAGNIDSCKLNITVADIDVPILINCPSDMTVSSGIPCDTTVTWVEPTITDNCDNNIAVVVNPPLGSTFMAGTTTVTYTATDGSGNVSNCSFDITVIDTNAPIITNCPVDMTISAGIACDTIVTWVEPTITDNCDNNVTVVVSPSLGSTFMAGTTTVTYTATDASGNISICEFDITVTDTEAPIITNCPADITISAGIACDTIVTWVEPTITDNCDNNVTVVVSPPLGSTFMAGTTTVTYTATDASGNVSMCEFDITVTVTDTEAPIITNCPVDMTISAGIVCDTVVTWVEPTITDNCDNNLTVVVSPPLGSTFMAGTTTVTYTATDASGNVSICEFDITVTVTDTEAPVITNCPADMTISAGIACDTIITWVEPTITDNCDNNLTILVSPPLGSIFMAGTTTVIYTATDINGNVSNCSFDITVTDTEAPFITNCPSDMTISAGIACETIVTWVEPTITDNCDNNITVVTSPALGSIFMTGTTTVTYTATDISGNISICEFDITVIETEAPIITNCPADMTISAGIDCEILVTWVEPTIIDNCDNIVIVVVSPPLGSIFMIGTTTVTYTASDASGNVSICEFDITVTGTDTEAPIITNCPVDMTISAGIACDTTVTWVEPTITDNCDNNVTVVASPSLGSTFMAGTTTVTYTATDINGNVSNCSFDITVTDTEAPIITNCPADMTIPAGIGCDTIVTWVEPTITDNCDNNVTVVVSPPLGSIFMAGTTTATYTATDASGNVSICEFDITVTETEAPIITNCPADMTIFTGTVCDTIVTWVEPTITDNCDNNVSVVVSPPLGSIFMAGTTTVTYTATDASGNVSICEFDITITVTDTEAPIITNCPADITISAGIACDTIVTWVEPTITDNCDNNVTVVVSSPLGAIFMAGITTVTYTATDINGNVSNCSFDITVTDVEAPIITNCPTDLTISAGIGCDTIVTWIEPTITDNCDNNVTVVVSPPLGSTFMAGTTTVTYTATDVSGNISNCSFDITVTDTEAPIITNCPTDMTIPPGISCDTVVTWVEPTITDNCDNNVTVVASPPSGSIFMAGTTTVTYTATDATGNVSICSFDITITDTEAPIITNCPVDMTIPAGIACDTIVTWTEPTIIDNCGDNNVTVVVSPPLGSIFMAGTTTVTYTATDATGNVSICSFDVTVTVTDTEAPIITNCPADMTISAGVACDTIVTWVDPTITDNCDNNVSVIVLPSLGSAFMVGTTTVTYYAFDVSGNVSICEFDITVTDTEAPIITNCPADLTISAGIACDTIVTWIEPTITDNCDNNVTVVVSSPLGSTFIAGTTTVTYTATDASGNVSICSFDITVTDTEAPIITNCPADMTIFAGTVCDTIVTWVEPTITDNCDNNVSVVVSPPLGTPFIAGTTPVTYTATDANGNVSICSFDITVTIIDTEAPTITNCPNDMVIPSGIACDTVVTWVEPTITDNCVNNVTVLVSPSLGSTFLVGTTTVTYTATDANGNVSICSFNITVTDTEAPIMTGCPVDMTISAGNNCSAPAVWALPTVTDICDPSPILVSNPQPGMNFPVGSTPVIITATDASGNVSTCSFNVIIIDVEVPSVFCPSDVTISTNGDIIDPNTFNFIDITTTPLGCDSVIIVFNNPSGNDNCGIPTITSSGITSGDTLGIGQHMIQFEAIDNSGNVSTVLCETIINVTSFVGLNVTATPDTICTAESTQLFAEPFTPVAGITYVWTGPNPNRMIPDVANPFLDNLAMVDSGIYIVTITDSLTNCTSTDSVMVVVSQGPELALIANTLNCVESDGSTDIPLSVQITNFVTVDSFIWTNPAGAVFSNDQNTFIFSASEADEGLYCVEVFEENGCSNMICDSIQITNIPVTPIIVSDCGDYVCEGESCTLTGVSIQVDSMVWTATGDSTGLPIDVNQSEITITPGQNGINLYTYTIIDNGCESSSTIPVIVSSPAIAEPDFVAVDLNTTLNNFSVIDNDTIPGSFPGIFSISVTQDVSNGFLVNHGDGTFTYTPNNGFLGDDQFIYKICLDCDGQEVCDFAIVTLSIDTDECIVYTVITPNNDGDNDTWEISCVKNNPDNEVIILNRWGDEVYRAAPYNNEWEGTYNNEDLPDGTYFYIFKKTANDPNPLKGTVNIYR